MYQKLFDYDLEFDFYRTQLEIFDCTSIVEFGCGTGNLASRFLSNKYDYLGVDLSQEMLDIAQEHVLHGRFVQSDVRSFVPKYKVDAALLTGRTITYLIEDRDLESALISIRNCLHTGGVFMFDAIDGPALFQDFDRKETTLIVDNYLRISTSIPTQQAKWSWDWHSRYYQNVDKNKIFLGEDSAHLRALDDDEVLTLLSKTGFELIKKIPKSSYTWQDAYFICKAIDG